MGGADCARKTLLPTRSFPLLAGGQSGELYYLGRGLLDCSPCGPEAPACGPRVEVQAGLTPQRGQSDRSTFEVHWNLLGP